MTPYSLPEIIYYRCGNVILTALPRTPVAFKGSSGATNAAIVKPRIPLGVTHFGATIDGVRKWRPISEIPKEWLPFVQRNRRTAMDPRE